MKNSEGNAKLILKHDGKIEIATGKHRREMNWKNRDSLTWSQLVKKLSNTHRTAEPFAEYLVAKKERQDEIKDVGGFVGGYLTNGRRKAGHCVSRSLITLDVDFATLALWIDFCLIYDCAACIYSTHKHSDAAPRFRLVLPLDRTVSPDEYAAISRRIAGNLGIEFFDPTTYQVERLMYWPSTSKDGAFFFEVQDGPWLSADEVLATYTNWQDVSEWPQSEKESSIRKREIKEQTDPLEKPGVIGAYCRTYTIHEVIEGPLADVYEASDVEGRYTYREGSTAAGLVTYDDKYAFSHHGTDPTSGKLCNAFDLVRLHRFGNMDLESKERTPASKLPSYLAMVEFATKDKRVSKQIAIETLTEARSDFSEAEDDTPVDNEWLEGIKRNRKGHALGTIDNLVLILDNDPVFKENICWDEFEARPVFARGLPWRNVSAHTRGMTDRDLDLIEYHIEKNYGITTNKLQKALSAIYEKRKVHPVRQYLESLKWDGRKRVETLFVDYMGGEDSIYVRAITRKTLVAAVARIFKPGIKFDYVLTLVGGQGERKSMIVQKIAKDWFSDTFNFHMIKTKEGFIQLTGAWIIEIGELSGMAKAEIEGIKSFVSAQKDRYRSVYGTIPETHLRQSIFFATTNKPDFLRDETGNRRFWPIAIRSEQATKDVTDDLTPAEVDQIWAEAVELYKRGEELYLSPQLESIAGGIQKKHTEFDDRSILIEEFLNRKLPENWSQMALSDRRLFLDGDFLGMPGTVVRQRVTISEIWLECFNQQHCALTVRESKPLRAIMANMPGWREGAGKARIARVIDSRTESIPQRYYERINTVADPSENVANTTDSVANEKKTICSRSRSVANSKKRLATAQLRDM